GDNRRFDSKRVTTMNVQNPQMLAYELAMHQRAQSQGQSAHIFHSQPPNSTNWPAGPFPQQQQQQMPQQQQRQMPPQQQQQRAPWGIGGPGPHATVVGPPRHQQQQWNGPGNRPPQPQITGPPSTHQQQRQHPPPGNYASQPKPWAPQPHQ
ncbi:unnamed protein product, partial [Ectocarpus fasciculatus]